MQLLLKAISAHHGFDFRDYDQDWLREKVFEAVAQQQASSITGLTERILHEPGSMARLLASLASKREAIFDRPEFFKSFREHVVPLLKTYPSFRIWHVACGSGEEVYSMAILLQEEGLYDRALLYGTELSEAALAHAQAGMYRLDALDEAGGNYLAAGGTGELSRYYTIEGSEGVFRPELKKNIFLTQHNLVTDGSLNEFQVIICRQALSRFAPTLRRHAHTLFYESLVRLGVLAIGPDELIERAPDCANFAALDPAAGIYRKKR